MFSNLKKKNTVEPNKKFYFFAKANDLKIAKEILYEYKKNLLKNAKKCTVSCVVHFSM